MATACIEAKTPARSWKNVGLEKSEHIARIVIDPRDSNVVYVAAQGPLWGPGGDRGLFKTTDGGKTWNNVLKISENTGVTDIAQDPTNPDVLYAASYQRRRHVWTLIDGGPESALYKSTDAGATWNKLKNGLPSVDMGRIGVAISPVDNNVALRHHRSGRRQGRHLPLARSRRLVGKTQSLRQHRHVLRPGHRRSEESRPHLRDGFRHPGQ